MASLFPIMELDHLDIIPSYACSSADCVGCYQKCSPDYAQSCEGELDLGLLTPFLDRYTSTIRVRSFGLFGGEITEYRNCVPLVEMLSRAFPGIRLKIVTNGQDHECVGAIIRAAIHWENIVLEVSLDGYGHTCDMLRGKDGYFAEAMLSIGAMVDSGLGHNVRVNARYYPQHRDSLTAMADHLFSEYGVPRNHIAFQSSVSRDRSPSETLNYMGSLRDFVAGFWHGYRVDDPQRWHPSHQPYNADKRTVFCVPGIQPDGYLYTCNNYNYGVRIGHISETDVRAMVKRMLDISEMDPDQCNRCLFGHCVWANYLACSGTLAH